MNRQRVWKYPIPVEDEFILEMPAGAHVLYVAAQGDRPYLWALIDPDAGDEPRRFYLRGTGHPLGKEPGAYFGSFMLGEGAFVGHLFGA